MNKLLSALALLALLPSLPAQAAPTQIAQVPLLNITGTGTVKPNLMLLFDNSGSMDQTYTPDYVNDSLCRSSVTLAAGITACTVGHPPFMSPDFNKQYYNPKIRYIVPIKSDGSFYPEQNAANTSTWTSVSGDGFGAHKTDLSGATVTSNINLVTGFPDLKWCTSSSSGDCKFNSSTYSYPDASYRTAVDIDTGPYYYTIGVGQYCADDTMKNCKSTTIGASAPAGFPVPVKVRWCSDRLLTTCQGKRVGTFIYPSYSAPTGAIASFGTIAIGASAGSSALTITGIAIAESGGSVNITSGTMTASTGTNTAIKQQAFASTVAANIIARSTTNQYYACVKTPTGQASVPACSVFGITLSADNVVAVVSVTCSGTKNLTNCVTVNDSSRAGWGFTVTAPAARTAPAYISFTGTTSNSGTPSVGTFKYNYGSSSTDLFSSLSVGKSQTAAQVASSVVTRIGTGGTYKAYVGDNAACVRSGLGTAAVCVVDSGSAANSGAITLASGSNGGSLAWTYTAALMDSIPTTTAALSAGSSGPNPFVRVNIVSGQTYPKSTERVDCAGATCTYAEEMTNFANWYVYYKSRLQMMKTSVGIAFSPITANYKVGFVKLSAAGAGGAIDMNPADVTGRSRATWYTTLYNTTTSGSTPIRTAMDNVGRMFANLTPYNYAAGQEVVQYPCQPNFMILTTDGYWNGSSTSNVVNNDNVENPSRFCTLSSGCVDTRSQTQPSISDVALHWYNGGSSTSTVSLRPTLEPDMSKPGSVPAASGENTHLHMNTYTLGLGVDGVMTYEANYDTAPKSGGDFYNLITQAPSGCPWNNNNAYVWPNPDTTNTANTVQERVDDLWHAAINGHGKYFSAQDPNDVVSGLREALSNMQVRIGSAAAAATSTPNITLTDNDIFSATFTTVRWYGELTDKKIDPSTGSVSATATWNTSSTVGKQAARTILMMQPGAGASSAPLDFTFANLSADAVAKGWFENKCSVLSQCTLLSAADKAIVNSGANMVNWLRGVQEYADDTLFRAYSTTTDSAGNSVPILIGDIASSKPAFVRASTNTYADTDYAIFKDTSSLREGTVYVAANDGMLHAFHAGTGVERWAYVPRITMSKLPALASTTYGTNHQFTADGSPEVADVKFSTGWRTVLVGGLNAGGRGFYALDVTDETAPKVLWEFCADPVVCPAHNDEDLGLSFGNPQFGTWKNASGVEKWVVFLTSGYNNIPGTDGFGKGSGKGMLYIVEVESGNLLASKSTDSGDTTTPSGLAKITAISDDPLADARVTYVYGGDNMGKMWRFDLTSDSGVITRLQMGDAGLKKPITTRPDVTQCGVPITTTDASGTSTKVTASRVVLFGTGRLLDVTDTSNTDIQSLYVLKDDGRAIGTVPASTMVEQTLSIKGSASNVVTYAVSNNQVDLTQKQGWYFDWKLNPGERMNLDPQIVSGVANVITNVPSSSSACSVGGTSNLYQIDVCNGQGVNGDPAGSTLSNTSAAVGFIIVRLPSGQLKLITTFADGSNSTVKTKEQLTADAHRVGWRRVKGE
jgi:type IV pilus assembly protein PilY1